MLTYDQTNWKEHCGESRGTMRSLCKINASKIDKKSFEKKTETKRRKIQEEKLCVYV